MKKRNIGKPQNLNHPERDRFIPSGSFLQLVCRETGFYGATLTNVGTTKPVFLECEELLGLAAVVERNRAWLEEHALANREWFHHEVAGRIVLVRLQRKQKPDDQIALSLFRGRFLTLGILPKMS